jgi:hypothetical protein
MQTNEIAQLIAQPGAIMSGHKNDLKELVFRYPFSQTLALLYLKSIAVENDIHFDSELGMHAFRITSREHLYNLIHTKNDHPIKEVEIEPMVVSIDLAIAEIIELKTPTEEVIEPIFNETINLEEIPLILEPIEESDVILSKEKVPVIDQFNPIEKIDIALKDGLDLDILAHAINNASETILEEKEELVSEQKESDLIDVKDTILVLPSKQSFTAWLQSSSKQIENKEESIKALKEDKSRALIDNFIETEPKITRSFDKETPEKVKKSFYTPQHAAKESVNEENLIMTETLAKIYVLQGNFPMAIKAYTQLQLLIPEKKSFFAIQIKELTTKISL